MTTFLWIVVILMAAALVAEILAFVGMALVAARGARQAAELTAKVKEKIEPSVRLVNELKGTVLPSIQKVSEDSKEIGSVLSARFHAIEAAYVDTSRRVERIRLRLTEGVATVEEDGQRRRGIYREVVEPIQVAGKVIRGLKLALWLLRKVA